MSTLWSLCTYFLISLAPGGEGGAVLMSQESLAARPAGGGPVRPLDVRPREAYDAGHLPGAVWVDLAAAKTLAKQPEGLRDQAAWSAWIEPLGIDPATTYVVYDGERQVEAARLWWLLKYLGVPRVALLDGSFTAWTQDVRPIQTEEVTPGARPFEVRFQAERLATAEDVAAMLEAASHRPIDARSDAEFAGTDQQSRRSGHLPAACHLEWTNFVDAKGRFLPLDALKAKAAAAGLKPGEPVVTHCQGGGRASLDAFVMERMGHPTRNYYLGWSDWGNRDDTPIANPGPEGSCLEDEVPHDGCLKMSCLKTVGCADPPYKTR